jgi:hypothetical protein
VEKPKTQWVVGEACGDAPEITRGLVHSCRDRVAHYQDKAFSREVLRCAKKYHKGLKRVQRAEACGDWQRAQALQHRLLTSYAAVLTCLIRTLPASSNLSIEQIRELARSLSPYADCGEEVLVKLRPKTSGGWRPISQFGMRRKTLQRLGADILQQRFPPEVFDFSCRGRGIEQASDRICELVVDEDCTHFAVFDLKDFYRPVQQEGLGEVTGLPVPTFMIRPLSGFIMIPFSLSLRR